MLWIFTRRRNIYFLVSFLFACQVYINYRQLRSFRATDLDLVGKTSKPSSEALSFKIQKEPRSNLTTSIGSNKEKSSKHLLNVNEDRRHQIKVACSDGVRGSVDRVIKYHNVSYCVTHKIASTFWIRIFRYLFNDTKIGHVNSPFDISKYDTHLLKYKHITEVPLTLKSEKDIFKTFRFMFVREPYARLWSVYIDKFLLPDNFFWTMYGKKIKAMRPKVQSRALCDPVSFPEFVKFIVKTGLPNGAILDDHFRPVHYGCNPCKFRPDLIGKMETMADDSRYILTRLGLSWVADVHSQEERIREEMAMLIDFNYELVVKRKLLARCVSPRNLAEKLWRAFQINGYIPADAKLTLPVKDFRDKNKVLTFVWKTFKAANRTSSMIKTQRENMKLKAYKDVPLAALKGIQKVFRQDFELFGYDSKPKDIFSQSVA